MSDTPPDAALARLAEGATDALTDDIVGRLAAVASEGLALLDAANRSGIARAMPALARLAADGDLDRLVSLSRLAESAGDALTDDIITRLAQTLSQLLVLSDRLTRDGLAERLLALAEQAERSHALSDFAAALDRAATIDAAKPPPAGGIGGLWQVLKTPEAQAALRFGATALAELRAARARREG